MRTSLAVFGVWVLAILLGGSLPVGGGDAVHGGALLHAAVAHVHSHTGRAAAPSKPLVVDANPTLDAGASTVSEIPTAGLTPPLPRTALAVPLARDQRLLVWPTARAAVLGDAPPDPPPTSRSTP